jgi:hypothetical protein
MLLTYYRPQYCSVVPLTVQSTLLRFLFWTCSLLTWSDSGPPHPCKDARHTFRVACHSGSPGTSGPGDSRLISGQQMRAPDLCWCSLVSLRFPCWGCPRFGEVGLPRPEGHAHLGAVQGKHRNTFQGQGRTDKLPARDYARRPSRARPASPATSGSAQTPESPLPRLAVSRRALRRKGRVDNNKPHGGRDPALPSSQCLGRRTRVPARSRGAGAAAAPDSHPSGPRRVLGGWAPTVVSVGGAAGAVDSRRRGQGGGRRWCGGPPAVLLPRAEEALPGKCRPCSHLAAGLARPLST